MNGLYESLLERVQQKKEIAVDLDLSYKVIFSALQGNYPVNSGISGYIEDLPVQLRLGYHIYSNTKGNYPVNTSLNGLIGDYPIQARMDYQTYYNTIVGNIPVNTGIAVNWSGKEHFLRMPMRMAIAPAIGSGRGGTKKKFGMHTIQKVKAGYIIEVDANAEGSGGPGQSAGRPISAGIHGRVGNIGIDLDFTYNYFTNTITARNPINTKATGLIRYVD